VESSSREVEMRAIKHWIKNTIDNQLAESAIKILESKREDVEVMVANNMFILTEFREKAEKEGLQMGLKQGLEQGIEQGVKQGIKQGIEQGIEKNKIENAKNLFDVLDDETISKKIKIDLDKVKKLRKEWEMEQGNK
jgi:similar to tr